MNARHSLLACAVAGVLMASGWVSAQVSYGSSGGERGGSSGGERGANRTPAEANPESGGNSIGYGGGGFQLERWEEDYQHLRNVPPDSRKDLFAPIKYIPLNDEGDIYLSFGGQLRYRYDYFNNFTFGPGANDEDGFHLTRYLFHVDAHLGEHVRGFAQLNGSFVDERGGGGRYGDSQHWDLQQGFIDLKTSEEADPYAYVRVGRQELIYGAERLVSPDDWRNVRRNFDGVKGHLAVENNTLEAFYTRPVVIDRDRFDNDDFGTQFYGIYNVTGLPGAVEKGNTKLELYGFGLNQTRFSELAPMKVDRDVYTLGTRFVTMPKPWDLDVELTYQLGTFNGESLNAWSVATEGGYTFYDYATDPRVSVGFDAASGSRDGSERFQVLFPPTYTYLGHLYLFGRSNLLDAHAGLDFHLTKDLTLYTDFHAFWRQDNDDNAYSLLGNTLRADTGTDEMYLGNEIDAVFAYQFNKNLSGYLGYAHFFTGDFFSNTGASKDVDFLYASVTFTF